MISLPNPNPYPNPKSNAILTQCNFYPTLFIVFFPNPKFNANIPNSNFIACFIESLDIINHHGFAMMINNIKTSYKIISVR